MDTLEVLHKEWIPRLELSSIAVLIGGLLLLMASAIFRVDDLAIGAMLTFATSLILDMLAYWCLYHLIKCPKCGHKLAKFKNGRNMPTKHAYSSFAVGAACRCCGWVPGT